MTHQTLDEAIKKWTLDDDTSTDWQSVAINKGTLRLLIEAAKATRFPCRVSYKAGYRFAIDTAPSSKEVKDAIEVLRGTQEGEPFGYAIKYSNALDTVTHAASTNAPDVSVLVEALEPFANALVNAEGAVTQGIEHRASHVIRATTFWLSFNCFVRAVEALAAYQKGRKK